MKRLKFFLLITAASLSLACCSQGAPVASAGTIGAAADTIEIESVRNMTRAEIGYHAAASLALAGIQRGLIKGHDAQAVRNLNRDATSALNAAEAAVTAVERSAAVARVVTATGGLQLFGARQSGEPK